MNLLKEAFHTVVGTLIILALGFLLFGFVAAMSFVVTFLARQLLTQNDLAVLAGVVLGAFLLVVAKHGRRLSKNMFSGDL